MRCARELVGLVWEGLSGCKRIEKDAGVESLPSYGTHVTVQLVHTSPVPDPKQSDYADCLYTAEAKVIEIRSGPRVTRELILVLPAFMKRILRPEASFNDGDVIDVDIIPHEKAGDRLKTMQRSDSMDRFDLPVFDGLNARKSGRTLGSFVVQPDSYFENEKSGPKPGSPAPAVRYPWSAKAGEERRAAITRDKETILKAWRDNGSDWTAWDDKLKSFRDDLFDQLDAAPKRELIKGPLAFHDLERGSYRKLCNKGDAVEPGPLMMLSSLNAQLRARGIDLIVVPFPTKEDVHAEEFSSWHPRMAGLNLTGKSFSCS